LEPSLINFPVWRAGKVIKADNKLNIADSLRLADEILSRSDEFLEVVRDCADKHGMNPLNFEPGNAVVEHKETPIIRFPKFEMRDERLCCIGSISLTACCEERRSKIWTRLSLREVDGRPAVKLATGDTQSYFELLYPMLTCFANGVTKQYEEIVKSMSLASSLEERYRFRIGGLNSSDDRLRITMDQLAARNISTLEETLEKVTESFHAYLPLFVLSSSTPPVNGSEMLGFARGPNRYMRYYEDREPRREFGSVSITETSANEARVNCLCFNAPGTSSPFTPADMATAAILNDYARVL
jgi:hypothetical protein